MREFQVTTFIHPEQVGAVYLSPNRMISTPQETGVTCFGLALDESAVVVAGVFGGRQTNLDDLFNHKINWYPCQCHLKSGGDPLPFTLSLQDTQLYPYDDLDIGSLRLCLHKGTLASQDLAYLGDLPRFYCWAERGCPAPVLSLLFEKLQRIAALPLDPDWYPALWQALVAGGYATPCRSFGGFAPLWEVIITQEEWQSLVLCLVKDGVLR